MKSFEWKMFLAGGSTWVAGTIYFFFRATATFEHEPIVYWSNAVGIIVAYVLLFRRLLKVFGVKHRETGSAALSFVVPGMSGEIIALLNSSVFLPGMHPQSVVVYAAFLFAGYCAVGCYALHRQRNPRGEAANSAISQSSH